MSNQNSSLYQISDIRQLENLAYQQLDLTEETLMLRAGKAAFDHLRCCWPFAKRILVMCGKGNNGGDGYVLAHLAATKGFEVAIRHIGALNKLKGAALAAFKLCQHSSIDIRPFQKDENLKADVCVDALLGIGIQNEVRSEFRTAVEKVNQLNSPVLSMDVPSGIDADTGYLLGVAVRATSTITFIALKRGLFTGNAPEYVGNVICHDLALPATLFEKVKPYAELLNLEHLKSYLPRRSKDAHKGRFGHVLVIGGNYGMPGAARLAAEAAERVGAGLVSVVTRPEHISVITSARPEIMSFGLKKVSELDPFLEKATVIVIGPGLGRDDWAGSLFERILLAEQPKVVDADALFWLSTLKTSNDQWVLTPHPGEAAVLLHCDVNEIQTNRFLAVEKIQKSYKGVCVLKGAGTLVKSAQSIVGVCSAGNPGMASGGMGDVLSGLIAGLLAQGLTIEIAARLGVMIHAVAADHATSQEGERGLLALDLMPFVRRIVNS